MMRHADRVVDVLATCTQPEMLLQMMPRPKLIDTRTQLRMKDGKLCLFLDDWMQTTLMGDSFFDEIKGLLAAINVDVHVANTPWDNLLSNCNSRVAGASLEFDDHIQACIRSEEPLHDRHLETVQALLHQNAPRVIIISEPYGFGKTRVSAVAACCRFPNQLIVMIVDAPNAEFAAMEASHTTATVVLFSGDKRSIKTVRSTDKTVIAIVKRNTVGKLGTALIRHAAAIIMDEGYRGFATDTPQYIQHAQKLAGPTTHWWITDAFVTARSGLKHNNAARRTWLWQQLNWFRALAGLNPIPRYAPRALIQLHVIQHAESVMNELAGPTTWWERFPSNKNLTYSSGNNFTPAKAAQLVQHIKRFFRDKRGLPRRVVLMGSFSNRVYVNGIDRETILASLRAQPGVRVFEKNFKTVTKRVDAFNKSDPTRDEIAIILISTATMKQVTLRANLMVCVGDATHLRDLMYLFADGTTRRRQQFATLASVEGRIRRCEPNPTEKFYRYLYEFVHEEPQSKRRKVAE